MVAGDIARILAEDGAGLVAESVPDRRLATIFPDRALDLVSRSRGAPEKPVGEAFRHDVPLVSRLVNWRRAANNSPIIFCDTNSLVRFEIRGIFRSVSRNGPCFELGLVDHRRWSFAEPGVRIPRRRRG